MTFEEILFIVVSSVALILLAIFVKGINWKKVGFKPKSILGGFWQIFLFNILIFFLVQYTIASKVIDLPIWMLDKDPILPLLAITFIQEILFRSLVISYFERLGKKKALWISIGIFVIFHLAAPYTWSTTGLLFAGLTVFAGYFWGWHFLKFRNIYLLGISHFLVNLSFNYVIFSF